MSSTLDFSVYRESCGNDEDFYDSSLSLADNLKAAFRQLVRLPDQNIQLPPTRLIIELARLEVTQNKRTQ